MSAEEGVLARGKWCSATRSITDDPDECDEEAVVLSLSEYERLKRCEAENAPGLPPYDHTFGDDRVCSCGHTYYRHFDTYDDMRAVGCKYCECGAWVAP